MPGSDEDAANGLLQNIIERVSDGDPLLAHACACCIGKLLFPPDACSRLLELLSVQGSYCGSRHA